MQARSKLIIAGLTAALLMALAVNSASASRLSTSNRNTRTMWTELRFFPEGGIINPELRCPLTLEGSFHSATIAKRTDALVGFVSRASIRGGSAAGECTGGTATLLAASLPWHVTYLGIVGSLPRPSGVILLLARTNFSLTAGGMTCLYGETGATRRTQATANIEANGLVTGITVNNSARIGLISGGGFCPPEGGFEGAGRVTQLGNTTNIRVTLI